MNFEMIDRILAQKSLAADPAFSTVQISIEPTPNLNGCPLGLYFPDENRIVLPPDAIDAALLHELGHAHGYFHYGDLSENYAEYFRKIYQPKGRTLLYMGNDFSNLPRLGALFEEGEKGAVEIALLQPLTPDLLYQIKTQFDSEHPSPGQPKVYYGNSEIPWVRVEFTKGADWLVIIGAAMAASVLATVGALGYAVYKVSEELPWIIPVSLLGTGMFFLLRAMAKEAKARVPAKA